MCCLRDSLFKHASRSQPRTARWTDREHNPAGARPSTRQPDQRSRPDRSKSARLDRAHSGGQQPPVPGLDLQPSLASKEIQGDTGLSTTAAGMLTSAPLLCLGLLAPAAAPLARRFGLRRVLLGCLVLLAIAAGFGATTVAGGRSPWQTCCCSAWSGCTSPTASAS
ncbi:MFS transporter [Amycolatopsis sp. H20-H5]|uniref:MFS transporter n=1 Tax=Amycolatopsis sp. H20-H5 TaxID=3046309 RepID=UPI003FA35AF4